MLAVVFWHRRQKRYGRDQYLESLIDFHNGLKAVKPSLFRFSATFETSGVQWFESDTEVFEDWYVMSKFAGMDALDEAVLEAPPCRKPHEWFMRKVEDAKGGFFGFTDGQVRIPMLPHATWFTKPQDCSIEDLTGMIGPDTAKSGYSFWTRAMGAGPVANCLLTNGPVALPQSYSPFSGQRTLVWSGI